jgi:hypothetical protein
VIIRRARDVEDGATQFRVARRHGRTFLRELREDPHPAAFRRVEEFADHPAEQFRVHAAQRGTAAFPQDVEQLLVPADVRDLVFQVRAMHRDEVRLEPVAIANDAA